LNSGETANGTGVRPGTQKIVHLQATVLLRQLDEAQAGQTMLPAMVAVSQVSPLMLVHDKQHEIRQHKQAAGVTG
jgi:hypothetical protein